MFSDRQPQLDFLVWKQLFRVQKRQPTARDVFRQHAMNLLPTVNRRQGSFHLQDGSSWTMQTSKASTVRGRCRHGPSPIVEIIPLIGNLDIALQFLEQLIQR